MKRDVKDKELFVDDVEPGTLLVSETLCFQALAVIVDVSGYHDVVITWLRIDSSGCHFVTSSYFRNSTLFGTVI